jgi:hypothetical protein
MDNPTHEEVVAPAPWRVQLCLVDAYCAFYDLAPTTTFLVKQPQYMYRKTSRKSPSLR